MKAVSGKRCCGILESNGWQLNRVTGLQRCLMKLADIAESDL